MKMCMEKDADDDARGIHALSSESNTRVGPVSKVISKECMPKTELFCGSSSLATPTEKQR